MMKTLYFSLLLCLMSLGHSMTSNAANESVPSRSLEGTIWMSAESHDLSQLSHLTKFTRNMGTDIVIYFSNSYDGRYSIKVDRLNAGTKTDFNTRANLTPNGNNRYIYQEWHPRPLSDFSGRKGHGIFRILDAHTAELSDVRRLRDGSAHTFVIKLQRVNTLSGSPVARTRPRVQ